MNSLDLNPIHTMLIGNNASYVRALEKAAFNRKEGAAALIEDINKEINAFLVESGRKFELFITDVDYLSFLSGNGEEYIEAIEDAGRDVCYVVVADTGLNIVGNKIKLALDWFDVKYLLIHNDSFFTLEMMDGAQISISNVFLSDIIRQLFLTLNSDKQTESQIPVFKEIFS
jgi:hypothetical protein